MNILIAEDDIIYRKILQWALKSLKHNVEVAKNGSIAWEIWQKKQHQLIISDWVMPGMTGIELCQKIRAHNQLRYTYIIMLSKMGGRKNYLKAMDAGVDDFISKPFYREQVLARIRVAERILSLQSEISNLSELLPICSYCKRIRDDENYWEKVESYIKKFTNVRFSHGICPDCYDNISKPQLDLLKKSSKKALSV